jgi:hypothetical protein
VHRILSESRSRCIYDTCRAWFLVRLPVCTCSPLYTCTHPRISLGDRVCNCVWLYDLTTKTNAASRREDRIQVLQLEKRVLEASVAELAGTGVVVWQATLRLTAAGWMWICGYAVLLLTLNADMYVCIL